MAVTKIADVIIPEVFNPYVVQRTMELSAIFSSGIVQRTPEFDRLASSGAKTINMPYWTDLTGADEVLTDQAALTPDKIGMDFPRLIGHQLKQLYFGSRGFSQILQDSHSQGLNAA